MDELISRQAAIDAINRAVTKEVARWSVEALPSAEVEPVCEYWDSEGHFCALHRPSAEPVKHGRWEWRKEKTLWQTGYYCSECQAFFGKDYDMVQYFKHCPNCGAKMQAKEEG